MQKSKNSHRFKIHVFSIIFSVLQLIEILILQNVCINVFTVTNISTNYCTTWTLLKGVYSAIF